MFASARASAAGSASFNGCYSILGASFFFNDIVAANSLSALNLGSIKWAGSTVYATNCTGPQYYVVENSIINMFGQTCPGNAPGGAASGGQFIP
jgi:hypothetical protein